MIKNYLSYAVAAALFAASGTSNLAFAVDEENWEQLNKPFDKPQLLVVTDPAQQIVINGRIGISETGDPVADNDFYAFYGKEGNLVTLNIDGGWKAAGTGRSLNSAIAIFDPNGNVLAQRHNVSVLEIDSGSIGIFDPLLSEIRLPADGIYRVGVTSDIRYADGRLRQFISNGETTPAEFVGTSTSMLSANGTYILRIDGASATPTPPPPEAIHVNIDVKPNARSITTHANWNGKIPVVLKTSKDFDALKADRDSIKFGPLNGKGTTGKCNKNGADLLCHFDKQDAGFGEEDSMAVVTGKINGKDFKGQGWAKVVPVRSKE